MDTKNRRYQIQIDKILSPEEKVRFENFLGIDLGEGKPVWDPAHDQEAKCARQGCCHPYERHFYHEDFGDEDSFWITSCKYCVCFEFVEPSDADTAKDVAQIEAEFQAAFKDVAQIKAEVQAALTDPDPEE